MESKNFNCVVEGVPITGWVTSSFREIDDYKVRLQVGEGDSYHELEFEMVMVSTPPLYVVNRLTVLVGFGPKFVYVEQQRQKVAQCFESTLRFVVSHFIGSKAAA